MACECGGRDPSPKYTGRPRVGGRLYITLSYAPSQISLSSMGRATCTGLCALFMKVECLQGAPPHLHKQNSYARNYGTYTAVGEDCPLQLPFCLVYHYLPPWCVRCFPVVGQRVNCTYVYIYYTHIPKTQGVFISRSIKSRDILWVPVKTHHDKRLFVLGHFHICILNSAPDVVYMGHFVHWVCILPAVNRRNRVSAPLITSAFFLSNILSTLCSVYHW